MGTVIDMRTRRTIHPLGTIECRKCGWAGKLESLIEDDTDENGFSVSCHCPECFLRLASLVGDSYAINGETAIVRLSR